MENVQILCHPNISVYERTEMGLLTSSILKLERILQN